MHNYPPLTHFSSSYHLSLSTPPPLPNPHFLTNSLTFYSLPGYLSTPHTHFPNTHQPTFAWPPFLAHFQSPPYTHFPNTHQPYFLHLCMATFLGLFPKPTKLIFLHNGLEKPKARECILKAFLHFRVISKCILKPRPMSIILNFLSTLAHS